MEKKYREKTKKEKRLFLLSCFFWGFIAAIFLFIIIMNFIFPEEVSNIIDKIGDKALVIIKSFIAVIVMFALLKLTRFIMKKLMTRSKKGKTIMGMLDSFLKYIAVIILLLVLLALWGVNTTALLAGAGILGLVFGLGAQSLISDIISGLFIIFEGDYQVGDIVVIDDYRGEVLNIGIRTTKIKDSGGNIKIINNSNITSIVNMTNDLSVAVCDVGIEYGDSLERIEVVLMKNLDGFKERIPSIVEGPFYKGVESLGDSAVILRLIAKVKESDKFQVTRDLNREIKLLFDKNDINIAYPQVVINQPIDFKAATLKNKREARGFIEEQREISKDIDEKN